MKNTIFLIFFIFLTKSLNAELLVKEIKDEEVWSGKIFINGIVAVRASGRLIIKEGTTVFFKTFDYDDDGIGDGELYVEGEIIAKGTINNPIVFTSDQNQKAKSQWKYVMVNHAKKAFFDYVIFESAFSGLQIHFSEAIVKNSIFRNNVDGFRFSTSNIYVCNNIMTENRHGIRYEERDSKGVIEFNRIYNNEIGIFPVTACKNKVSFQYNVIEKNGYNIKVGDEQKSDLDFKNNFFGMIFEKDIRKTIYDKNFDKNLPKVNIRPFLKKEPVIGESICIKD